MESLESFRPSYLDLPISVFAHAWENQPEGVTTLRKIAMTSYYREPIKAIQAEPDEKKQKELKQSLRAYSPISFLLHRKKDTEFSERILQQWPVLFGDVDKQDNPRLDMVELKQHLCTLPYVLFCAFSVRGGLWFVVRLPDHQTPDTLAGHFRHLQREFGGEKDGEFFGMGVRLDSTKGGNPTDLRYVSYDAKPFINENATVMVGTYTPPKPKPQPVNFDRLLDEDSGKLLERLLKPVQLAGDGQRHETLLKAAKLAGGFIAANRLDEQTAILALETVVSEWPMLSKSQKTIRDGITYGKSAPIYSEVRERPANWKEKTWKPRQQTQSVKSSAILETYTDEGQPYDYPVEISSIPAAKTKPVEEAGKNEEQLVIIPEPTPFRLPWLIESYWQKFSRPPIWFNLIRQHKAVLRSIEPINPRVIVTSTQEQLNSPGAIIRPTESQLDRQTENPCDHYSPIMDEPKDLVPQIREIKVRDKQTFFEWQRSNPSFSNLGLASLQPKQDIPYRNDESTTN